MASVDAYIRFAPNILRRLGEELNPSPDQGIIELIKNAYDANARHCTVELLNTDQLGGTIRVIDDGDGMDEEGIANGWLVLGESNKSSSIPTRLGRLPAGSKGLGRLAALRMGKVAHLTTWPRVEPTTQYELEIKWDDYSNARTVEDIALKINRSNVKNSSNKSGSEILISNINTRIGRMDVKRLARALVLLADPFEDDPSAFRPTLAAPEFKDLEALVKNRYFNDADYHLVASVDGHGEATAKILDWQGKELFTAAHNEIAKSIHGRPYKCPVARFDLWVFILNQATFSGRSATMNEVRAWLEAFGGVHLYQNGLRVGPYGNAGNDWLDMNLRRARDPEERPSTNTSIGRISVVDSSVLLQKTDRSGFIEDEMFTDLRAFGQDSMEWLAKCRMSLALKRRTQERTKAPKKASRSKRNVEKAIASAPSDSQQGIKDAFAAYEKAKNKEVQELRKEIQLYRTLSTAGITAATFAHESNGNPIKVIELSIATIQRRATRKLADYATVLKGPVDAIIRATESLAVLGSATLKLLNNKKRRLGRVNIHDVISDTLSTFTPFLDGRDVKITEELCHGSPYLRSSEAAIESIITNLLNNSLAALESSAVAQRRIIIRTKIIDDKCKISVLDNGTGIEHIDKNDIWLPGQTTRENGTGLGLTIVYDTVKDLGGEVDALEHSELGGAEIIIMLSILGV